MHKFSLILGILCILVSSSFSYADTSSQQKLDRSFSFSSGYLERVFNSNEGLSAFPLSAIQLYSNGFDVITGGPAKTTAGRLGVVLLELPVSYWFAHSIFIPYHEFGHARVVAGNNTDYSYTSFGWGGRMSKFSVEFEEGQTLFKLPSVHLAS